MEPNSDYGGPAIAWGAGHKTHSAAACCQACKDFKKRPNGEHCVRPAVPLLGAEGPRGVAGRRWGARTSRVQGHNRTSDPYSGGRIGHLDPIWRQRFVGSAGVAPCRVHSLHRRGMLCASVHAVRAVLCC
jgi:hypothetical protein